MFAEGPIPPPPIVAWLSVLHVPLSFKALHFDMIKFTWYVLLTKHARFTWDEKSRAAALYELKLHATVVIG